MVKKMYFLHSLEETSVVNIIFKRLALFVEKRTESNLGW